MYIILQSFKINVINIYTIFCKESNYFILQGHIKFIKSDPKEIKCYKAFLFKKNLITVSKNIKQKNCFKMQDVFNLI